jgi:hypothetical protein
MEFAMPVVVHRERSRPVAGLHAKADQCAGEPAGAPFERRVRRAVDPSVVTAGDDLAGPVISGGMGQDGWNQQLAVLHEPTHLRSPSGGTVMVRVHNDPP